MYVIVYVYVVCKSKRIIFYNTLSSVYMQRHTLEPSTLVDTHTLTLNCRHYSSTPNTLLPPYTCVISMPHTHTLYPVHNHASGEYNYPMPIHTST
ncbi:hypothetical protein EON63_11450 [archaeon]|nr:MAG: hypothetical protein EON63_11450 [archaeon]